MQEPKDTIDWWVDAQGLMNLETDHKPPQTPQEALEMACHLLRTISINCNAFSEAKSAVGLDCDPCDEIAATFGGFGALARVCRDQANGSPRPEIYGPARKITEDYLKHFAEIMKYNSVEEAIKGSGNSLFVVAMTRAIVDLDAAERKDPSVIELAGRLMKHAKSTKSKDLAADLEDASRLLCRWSQYRGEDQS
jgi:hypothetical protein